MNRVAYLHHDSPIGPLLLAASERGLRAVTMDGHRHLAEHPDPRWSLPCPSDVAQSAILERARRQLDDYFGGRRVGFDVPIDVDGTDFQRSVWRGLAGIAFGATISYGELARRIGNPKAVRAVGLANGRNPVSIIVPCHRVIGADGSMTGYGGGLERKVFLLALEANATGFALASEVRSPWPGARPPGDPGSRF